MPRLANVVARSVFPCTDRKAVCDEAISQLDKKTSAAIAALII
jgi:ABC-type glutathione transport system ATPase component